MPRNIEIKAQLQGRLAVEAVLAELDVQREEVIQQHDTFYCCAQGRLKLRRFGDDSAELIYYRRVDSSGAKESSYLRTPISDPKMVHTALALSNGVRGDVKKTRHLYKLDRTRIHLDRVDGLGEFLELEVMMQKGEPNTTGIEEANRILDQLGIPESACLAGAYIDLILARESAG